MHDSVNDTVAASSAPKDSNCSPNCEATTKSFNIALNISSFQEKSWDDWNTTVIDVETVELDGYYFQV